MEDYNNLTKSINNFVVKKGKVYLKPGQQPPKGTQVMRGKKGGTFYNTGNLNRNSKTTQNKPASSLRDEQLNHARYILRHNPINPQEIEWYSGKTPKGNTWAYKNPPQGIPHEIWAQAAKLETITPKEYNEGKRIT